MLHTSDEVHLTYMVLMQMSMALDCGHTRVGAWAAGHVQATSYIKAAIVQNQRRHVSRALRKIQDHAACLSCLQSAAIRIFVFLQNQRLLHYFNRNHHRKPSVGSLIGILHDGDRVVYSVMKDTLNTM